MMPMTLPQTNGATASTSSNSWKQASVQAFFTRFNWEDHPPEIQEIKLTSTQNGTEPLSLNLSVCQFFATVNWDGNVIAAAVQLPSEPAPEPTENLTLDDFFGLF